MASNTSGSDINAPIFVDGLAPEKAEVKGPPKLYHKKSRTGCQRCRARRVKCNEVHPICGNCERHKLECVYDRQKPSPGQNTITGDPESHEGRLERSGSDSSPANVPGMKDTHELPENTSRRYLELRLLHQFIVRTGPSISSDSVSRDVVVNVLPAMALNYKGLLYAMYAVTALHLVQADLGNADILACWQTYFDLALQEHLQEVAQLSKQNVDAICLTSTVLRVITFVMLQTRPLQPYAPPMQFLQVTHGAVGAFEQAWHLVRDDENSPAARLMARMPLVTDEKAKFDPEYRQGLLHLLQRSQEDEQSEPWTPDIQEAYETTLSFIGGTWLAMANQEESPAAIRRRVIVFAMMIRPKFIELVGEQRPRALVILAHFFALVSMFQNIWWIGGTGPREVLAIQAVLPPQWQDLMSWPLQTIEQKIIYT